MAIVFWLIPAEPARTFFLETIRRLAAEHDAPTFEPHLTLGLGSAEQLSKVDVRPFDLRINGVDWSEKFTKTLFVRFELEPSLAQLRASLKLESAGYGPHVSLLYRALPDATKRRLAGSISLPFSSVVFNTITTVRCPDRTTSREDVEAWATIDSHILH
ncbi:MAG TPA: hypothetical protein VGG02_09010 [Chthoniobacterales bacterium]|jgi:hypothetical protein